MEPLESNNLRPSLSVTCVRKGARCGADSLAQLLANRINPFGHEHSTSLTADAATMKLILVAVVLLALASQVTHPKWVTPHRIASEPRCLFTVARRRCRRCRPGAALRRRPAEHAARHGQRGARLDHRRAPAIRAARVVPTALREHSPAVGARTLPAVPSTPAPAGGGATAGKCGAQGMDGYWTGEFAFACRAESAFRSACLADCCRPNSTLNCRCSCWTISRHAGRVRAVSARTMHALHQLIRNINNIVQPIVGDAFIRLVVGGKLSIELKYRLAAHKFTHTGRSELVALPCGADSFAGVSVPT